MFHYRSWHYKIESFHRLSVTFTLNLITLGYAFPLPLSLILQFQAMSPALTVFASLHPSAEAYSANHPTSCCHSVPAAATTYHINAHKQWQQFHILLYQTTPLLLSSPCPTSHGIGRSPRTVSETHGCKRVKEMRNLPLFWTFLSYFILSSKLACPVLWRSKWSLWLSNNAAMVNWHTNIKKELLITVYGVLNLFIHDILNWCRKFMSNTGTLGLIRNLYIKNKNSQFLHYFIFTLNLSHVCLYLRPLSKFVTNVRFVKCFFLQLLKCIMWPKWAILNLYMLHHFRFWTIKDIFKTLLAVQYENKTKKPTKIWTTQDVNRNYS